jgi:hypothetical protein
MAMNRLARLLFPLALLLSAQGASAQQAQPDLDDAKERYLRALELYQDGLFDAALLEFERAYELAPTYRLLYNLAVVHERLSDFAAAYKLYRRYLDEGEPELDAERRNAVRERVTYLETRIARLTIEVNVAGATIAIDDEVVGTAPLSGEVVVNLGRRRVTVSAAGHLPSTRVAEVAGGETEKLAFVLEKPSPPSLSSSVPRPMPEELPPAPAPEPVIWPYWATTAALGVAASAVSVKAYVSRRELDEINASYGSDTESEFTRVRERAQREMLIADVLWGATAVAGGVAVYMSLSSGGTERRPSVSLGFSPGALRVSGNF